MPMDPLTHATSGALLALSLAHKPATRLFVPLAALVAASPDLDVIVAPLPLDFLLLHRGITHSLAAVPIMAFILVWCLLPVWRGHNAHPELTDMRNVAGTYVSPTWSFWKTYFFTAALLLLHIWLDCVTSYGTMIFLPFSDYRVRLNGIFIVDVFLAIPMLVALIKGWKGRQWAAAGLIWIFLYPAACVALRIYHEENTKTQFAQDGRRIEQLSVLPDAFAPLYWRLIYEEKDPFPPKEHALANTLPAPMQGFYLSASSRIVYEQGLNAFGKTYTRAYPHPALPKDMALSLRDVSIDASAFLNFSVMPVFQVKEISPNHGSNSNAEEFVIFDLRFGSMLPFVKNIMDLRNAGTPPFLFFARHKENKWTEVRMAFISSGKQTSWKAPIPPRKSVPWWQWVLGIQQ